MKTIKNPFLYIAIAAIAFAACTNKEVKTNSNSADVGDVLTYEVAKRYVKNYERHAGFVEGSKGDTAKIPNTRAIWFSALRLENLARKIREEGGDGIRFYLATYDKIGATNTANDGKYYLGHNTLVMVSTYPDGKNHRDYYTDKPGKNGAKGYIIGTPPANRGEMCPPPKYCDSVGALLIDPPVE